jgi:hypothetical protein
MPRVEDIAVFVEVAERAALPKRRGGSAARRPRHPRGGRSSRRGSGSGSSRGPRARSRSPGRAEFAGGERCSPISTKSGGRRQGRTAPRGSCASRADPVRAPASCRSSSRFCAASPTCRWRSACSIVRRPGGGGARRGGAHRRARGKLRGRDPRHGAPHRGRLLGLSRATWHAADACRSRRPLHRRVAGVAGVERWVFHGRPAKRAFL